MSDQIEQIVTALTGCCGEHADRPEHIAWAIHEYAPAGLLVTPEHDAAVAAKALRDFADGTRFPNNWILFRRDDGSGVTVSDLLRETADGYIERARGTSDADA